MIILDIFECKDLVTSELQINRNLLARSRSKACLLHCDAIAKYNMFLKK